MISMKDISVACDVSIATVSKALNGHNDIGEETKELVRRKAKEMGYSPNAQARALKTNRTYNLGVLFEDEAHSGLAHDYFIAVLNSFKYAVEEKGYDITFINGSRKKMTYLEHCRYRSFDGVMIASVNFNETQVLELIRSNIPLITIDYSFQGRITVISDNARGMRDLFTYIYSQGHRRIAYIHGEDCDVTQKRLSSFFKKAQEYDLEIPNEYIREAAYRDTKAVGRETAKLLDLKVPPTCIIFPDDFSGFGGMNIIRERGLRIPEDISVAGYDGIPLCRQIAPRLTTLRQDTEELGKVAARKLIDLIERPRATLIEQIIISGELYPGETVGPILLSDSSQNLQKL